MSQMIDDSLRRPLANGTILYNGRPGGTYKIIETLGIGGFGVTYKAQHLVLDQYVAIKEYMPQGLAMRNPDNNQVSNGSQKRFQDGLETFLDEARTLAKLRQNPGIVTVLDFFEENGTAYFVMEFYEGQSLNAYLAKKGGKIPPQEAFEMLNPIFDALRECHTAKDNRKAILHRDIKPDNIYVTHEGRVLLLDFGAAKQVTNRLTSTFSEIVSPHYSPPEQYSRTGQQGAWSDIYATAATFYRCIMGKDIPEALDRYQNEALNHNYPTDPETAGVLKKVITRALALKIADRTQTMETFQVPLYDHFVQQHLSALIPQEVHTIPTVVPEEVTPAPEPIVPEISSAEKVQADLAQISGLEVEREFVPKAFKSGAEKSSGGKEIFARPAPTPQTPEQPKEPRPSISERAARIAEEMERSDLAAAQPSSGSSDSLPDHLEVKPSKPASAWSELAKAKKKTKDVSDDIPPIRSRFDEPLELPIKEDTPKVEKPKFEKPSFGKSAPLRTAMVTETPTLPTKKAKKETFAPQSEFTESFDEGFTPNWRIIVPVLLLALAVLLYVFMPSAKKASDNNQVATTVSGAGLPTSPFAGQVWTSPTGIKFVWVDGGNAIELGDDADDLTDNPKHQVSIKGFWMGQSEVTQGQYEKIMGNNPSQFKGANLPVEQISYTDAIQFAQKLKGKEQLGYTLPSEAQWEFAAQGMLANPQFAWFEQNSNGKTQSVGSLDKSSTGVYDLLGNVKEWCLDHYSSAAYSQRNGSAKVFTSGSDQMVMRGGAYNEEVAYLSATARDYAAASEKHSSIGMRLVINP